MTQDDGGHDPARQNHTVLNVFGLTLEVSNPRLAELLTMDAREALVSDVRDLLSGASRDDRLDERSPDLAQTSAADVRQIREERRRAEFRARVHDAGMRLGFDVRRDGSWVSPTGITVLARDLPERITLAAGAHFVAQLQDVIARATNAERTSILFVVNDRDSIDVLNVAIRQARAHGIMRVACLDDLEDLAQTVVSGEAAHAHALAIIAPIAAIDVGELLAVLRAARSPHGPGPRDA